MLTEYALTPHLLDHEHNAADPNWLEQLRSFGERLLPVGPNRIYNNVVSDLCDGHWFANEIAPMIQQLEQKEDAENQRIPALDLLKALRPRVERHLVARPFSNNNWPADELDWANEAVYSSNSSGIGIHRIVSSSQLATNTNWTLLQDTFNEAFWEPVPPTGNPKPNLPEQLGLLRRMSAFYSFIAFASPFIQAEGSGKDLTFAVELAKSALDRPAGFGPVTRIDFHTEGTYKGDAERQVEADGILKRLQSEIGADASNVRVFLWRDVKERRLLVGNSDGSDRTPQIAWAVSMTHVVRPDTDHRDGDPHTFAVLSRAETSRLASDLYSNARLQPYVGSPFKLP